MFSLSVFDLNVYSEELHQVSESEYDEVIAASAVDEDWAGYSDWSENLTFSEGNVENLFVRNGKVFHKPQPSERERIQGIEI